MLQVHIGIASIMWHFLWLFECVPTTHVLCLHLQSSVSIVFASNCQSEIFLSLYHNLFTYLHGNYTSKKDGRHEKRQNTNIV